MKFPKIDTSQANLAKLDTAKLKFIAGVGNAGIKSEGWKDPEVIRVVKALDAEIKRREG